MLAAAPGAAGLAQDTDFVLPNINSNVVKLAQHEVEYSRAPLGAGLPQRREGSNYVRA